VLVLGLGGRYWCECAKRLLATLTLRRMILGSRKVDVRLPGKGNSNSHGARPVHLIITMIKWIRTSRLSIKNSRSQVHAQDQAPSSPKQKPKSNKNNTSPTPPPDGTQHSNVPTLHSGVTLRLLGNCRMQIHDFQFTTHWI